MVTRKISLGLPQQAAWYDAARMDRRVLPGTWPDAG